MPFMILRAVGGMLKSQMRKSCGSSTPPAKNLLTWDTQLKHGHMPDLQNISMKQRRAPVIQGSLQLQRQALKTSLMLPKSNLSGSSIAVRTVILNLNQKCTRCCSFISRLNCCLMKMANCTSLLVSRTSILHRMMKNPGSRQFSLYSDFL